jgi:hypothetical protein
MLQRMMRTSTPDGERRTGMGSNEKAYRYFAEVLTVPTRRSSPGQVAFRVLDLELQSAVG